MESDQRHRKTWSVFVAISGTHGATIHTGPAPSASLRSWAGLGLASLRISLHGLGFSHCIRITTTGRFAYAWIRNRYFTHVDGNGQPCSVSATLAQHSLVRRFTGALIISFGFYTCVSALFENRHEHRGIAETEIHHTTMPVARK